MGDDHGWDETAYNGHPHLKTPVFDEMAATGLRLDHFYSAHPLCSPTLGSVITGRHPIRYGTHAPNWSMRPEELFDLKEDPAETKNLIENKPEVPAKLSRELRDWQQSVLTSLAGADYGKP